MDAPKTIAYFSMEIALEDRMPTYAGGLGVLAGDTIRAAASLHLPMVAVTLLYRKGHFRQRLDDLGQQSEEDEVWPIDSFLIEKPNRVQVNIEKRVVHIRVWEYRALAKDGFFIPIYFLDTDLPANSERDRRLTDHLYGGGKYYRLCQEIVLGIGGVRILRSLGHHRINRFHLNEGHASLLTLELLDESVKRRGALRISEEDIEPVRKLCVFTTHTPVASGHDRFSLDLVKRVLDRDEIFDMKDVFCCENELNMTFLALNLSHYINGVAKKHGETSRMMYAKYRIDSITNGVHPPTWTAPAFQDLFDKYIPGWQDDNFSLRYALSIPKKDVWAAHMQAKTHLFKYVQETTNLLLDPDILTLGFARRSTAYKRAMLLFSDVIRLETIAAKKGPLQIIYAGKAHPRDNLGKQIIVDIFQVIKTINKDVKILYLENYGLGIAKLLTSGVDLWLNTPEPPLEASGTSGMKAALNGVPSLSILDGWWIEGCIEGVTGWAIEHTASDDRKQSADARALLSKLENTIVPLYYQKREQFIEIMSHCIALNGSFFNTQRMLQQYVSKAYFE